jgi:Protein of unknown function, DUF488
VNTYTIGFTRRTAREFFDALRGAGIRRLVDVRLHNASQLAGFTKREDLAFFLHELCGAEYQHELILAPTEELFTNIQQKRISWKQYEERFLALLAERRAEARIAPGFFQVPKITQQAKRSLARLEPTVLLGRSPRRLAGLRAVARHQTAWWHSGCSSTGRGRHLG